MSAQPQTVVAAPESQPKYSTFYIWYVAAVLAVAYVFSFIDGQIFNLTGLGIGPSAVAWVTQYVFHRDGALRYSMVIVLASACGLSALLLGCCMTPFLTSLEGLRLCGSEHAQLRNFPAERPGFSNRRNYGDAYFSPGLWLRAILRICRRSLAHTGKGRCSI